VSRRLLWWTARAAAAAAVARRTAGAGRLAAVVEARPGQPASVAVSVVVPARNEATRLGRCLGMLRRDPFVTDVVVVDDESSDGTGALAATYGATVVPGRPLPPGWVGKSWALQQGVEAAGGEWIVTLDADVVPAEGLVAGLVQRSMEDGWDLLSVAGRFEWGTAPQLALHASMLTTLVYRFGLPGSRRRPRPTRVMANGQCMVFRRGALLAGGGLEPVRRHLSDDVALARHLAGAGWRVGFLDAGAALGVGVPETAGETWRHWGRSLAMADATSALELTADLGVVWLAQGLPLARLLLGRADGVDVACLVLRASALVSTRRAYHRPGSSYWASPALDLAAATRMTTAVLRPPRSWRGRRYGSSRPGAGSAPSVTRRQARSA
jgi:dolichol-phosphate mannosyltransferase